AGHAHQAAAALGEGVVAGAASVWAGLPVPADRGVDHARVRLGDLLVSEAQARRCAGPEVLDDDLCLVCERAGRGPTLSRLQVEGDTALAAIDGQEVRRLVAL